MADDRRTHRSYVSYIDKSREYYAAQGYKQAYAWPHYVDVPFAPLTKPLSECRVGLVTTSYFPRGAEPEGVPQAPPKMPYAARCDDALGGLYNDDLLWDRAATHTRDLDTYLPVNRLRELEAEGRIGSLSDRFYGVNSSEYSQRRTEKKDAPEILGFMREDEVDVALMVPL